MSSVDPHRNLPVSLPSTSKAMVRLMVPRLERPGMKIATRPNVTRSRTIITPAITQKRANGYPYRSIPYLGQAAMVSTIFPGLWGAPANISCVARASSKGRTAPTWGTSFPLSKSSAINFKQVVVTWTRKNTAFAP